MKKLALIAFAITILSCQEKTNTASDYAIISGQITNKPSSITINTFDKSFSKPLNISEDGSFKDTINTSTTNYVLYDGQNPIFLYVEPGYDLNISYNTKDFNQSLQISGTGAEANNYLIEKNKLERQLFGNARQTYELNELEYKTKIDSVKTELVKLLESFNVPNSYAEKEKRNLHYTYLRLLSIYEATHKQVTQNFNFKVSDGFLKELDDVDYSNEEDFKFSETYKSLVADFYLKKADSLSKKDGLPRDLTYLNVVSNIENETIKNNLLFSYTNSTIARSSNAEAMYKLFKEHSTNEANNKIIDEKYNKLSALNVGKPSPKFTNYKNHNGGTTSLDDLKGKYLYIDVWATWCGPCIRQIPALKKLEEQYHDKNIEFVSISIDKASDFEKWKKMVDDKDLKGVQLFADNDWNSQFVKDYGIQGIPRFILLDPEGNIVNANAPRPTDPALINLFNELNL